MAQWNSVDVNSKSPFRHCVFKIVGKDDDGNENTFFALQLGNMCKGKVYNRPGEEKMEIFSSIMSFELAELCLNRNLVRFVPVKLPNGVNVMMDIITASAYMRENRYIPGTRPTAKMEHNQVESVVAFYDLETIKTILAGSKDIEFAMATIETGGVMFIEDECKAKQREAEAALTLRNIKRTIEVIDETDVEDEKNSKRACMDDKTMA